jgi:hypothetical protein
VTWKEGPSTEIGGRKIPLIKKVCHTISLSARESENPEEWLSGSVSILFYSIIWPWLRQLRSVGKYGGFLPRYFAVFIDSSHAVSILMKSLPPISAESCGKPLTLLVGG